ncbi:MAG: glutamyl-tRNA reductase [Gemmatimonadaceae bacterium]|nr:glutamyl-tRNA reductase [Gemmatimonadaceae bacterium]
MAMTLTVVGVSHRTASLDVRERLVIGPSELSRALAEAAEATGAREAVFVSTCIRTELYLAGAGDESVAGAMALIGKRIGESAEPYAYVRRDREAAAHLFRVASGLDSMILGEAQIQGQVRDAWELGRSASGTLLNRLFQSALGVASRVRTETALGRGAASVSSAAVQLAKQIFGSLNGRRAMVLGAGEMAELALECLTSEGVRAAIVANRTHERAKELAARYGATAMHVDECWAQLADVDVLLCSTAAPHPVVRIAHLEAALARRGHRPLCILDIALPRDVEPEVRELSNVFLYDLDDLRAVVAANIERRREHLPSAEQVIAEEVERYWQWVAGLHAVPVVTEVRAAAERMRQREVAQLLRKMPNLAPAEREAIEQLSRALMNKFLHEPSVRLRAAAANGRGLAVVDAARYLFGIGAPEAASEATGEADPAAPDHHESTDER